MDFRIHLHYVLSLVEEALVHRSEVEVLLINMLADNLVFLLNTLRRIKFLEDLTLNILLLELKLLFLKVEANKGLQLSSETLLLV